MIKCDIYPLHKNNIFTNVLLELLPKKILISFTEKKFSILYKEIISYSYNKNKLNMTIYGGRSPINVVIRPYKHSNIDVILSHLNNYCNS